MVSGFILEIVPGFTAAIIPLVDGLVARWFSPNYDSDVVSTDGGLAEPLFDDPKLHQCFNEHPGTRRGFAGQPPCLADNAVNAYNIASECTLDEAATQVPFSGLKNRIEISGILKRLAVIHDCFEINFLTGKGRNRRENISLLIFRKSAVGLLLPNFRELLFRFRELAFQSAKFGRMARISIVLIGLSLFGGGYFGYGNQVVFAQTISERDNLRSAEQEKADHPKPEPEMRPSAGVFYGIPSGPPRHDYSPLWLIAVAVAFLSGFTISNLMNRRHIERLREIWHK